MTEPYAVPSAPAQAELEVRGSRFLAHAFPTATVADARGAVDAVRRALPGATHYVYAFRVGGGATVTDGMSDDGEPSGTAGPPALAVLRGSGLGDTTVVIARFFGGTKLGTGGLVRAYGDATRLVLDAVVPVQRVVTSAVRVRVPYGAYDPLLRLLDDCGAHDVQAEFAVEVSVTARLPAAELPGLREGVAALTAGAGELEELE